MAGDRLRHGARVETADAIGDAIDEAERRRIGDDRHGVGRTRVAGFVDADLAPVDAIGFLRASTRFRRRGKGAIKTRVS
jgi:hypothetical protein